MSYSRFVPGFSRHMKLLKAGPVSSWLWACSVDHCTEYLTDGFLDDHAVPGLCAFIHGAHLKRAVDNLVSLGLWDKAPGGYQVHNYLKHNLSKAQVEAERASARTRYLRGKGGVEGVSHAATSPETQPPEPTLAPSSQPEDTLVSRQRRSVGQSVGLDTPNTSKGPVAHATGSNGTDEESEAKRQVALTKLYSAFPELQPLPKVQAMTPRQDEPRSPTTGDSNASLPA